VPKGSYAGRTLQRIGIVLSPAGITSSRKYAQNRSGGTRTRTGDTMIFSHMSRPLGMRFYRISKRISVHRVSLDIAWCRPYCCITVDMAFVTLRGTRSRTHTSARLTRLLGYSRPPLSFGDVPGSGSRSVSSRNFAEKQEKESRQADSNRGHHDFQWRDLCSPPFMVVQ